jgi:GNAT superfamily N-acetyltransferase
MLEYSVSPPLIPADVLEPDALATVFNRAFEGYFVPMVHTVESLAAMIANNDIQLDHSLVLRAPGQGYAGVALLARRGPRSWVGGMGIVPEWRGLGLGAMLLREVIERARSFGIRTMQLEVLEQNVVARRLYESLGFHVVRPLPVYTGVLTPIPGSRAAAVSTAGPIGADEALASFSALHEVALPWQREYTSLEHLLPRLRGLGLHGDGGLRAATVYVAGDSGFAIMDLGSRGTTPSARALDGVALLSALSREAPELPVRAINVPPGDPLGDALTMLACPVVASQWEMALDLV